MGKGQRLGKRTGIGVRHSTERATMRAQVTRQSARFDPLLVVHPPPKEFHKNEINRSNGSCKKFLNHYYDTGRISDDPEFDSLELWQKQLQLLKFVL